MAISSPFSSVPKIYFDKNVTIGALAPGANVNVVTLAIAGLTKDMFPLVRFPDSSDSTWYIVNARVSANNTLELWILNPVAPTVTPGSIRMVILGL